MEKSDKNKISLVSFFFLLFLFLSSQIGFAQNIPPGAEPGAEAQRFKEQSERQKRQLEKKKIEVPTIETPQKEEKPIPSGASFILKEVKIVGVSVLTRKEMLSLYELIRASYYNKKIQLKDLEGIVKEIQSIYEKKGYLTTNVYIPEQDIKNGVVEIRVFEGKMGKLKVEGNKYFSTSLIDSYFHTKKNEVLNIVKLKRDILRLNQNPDMEVKVFISAGEEPGTSDITLQAKDKFPWHIGLSEDNQGIRLTGKYRTSYTLRSSNLTGHADTFFESTMFSNNSFGQSASYMLPLGTKGTKLKFDFTYFKMKIGKEFTPYDIIGRTQIYTPSVSWELALNDDYQANLDLGLDIKSIIKKEQSQQIADDQLRLPWFGFNVSKQDVSGRTTFIPRLTFGTSGFLGASCRNHPSASRAGTGGSFVKYTQYLNRTQRMPFKSYMTIRSQYQLASHTLPSAEQFQLGGAYSVRGYPESMYLSDIGASLSVDWLFPMYIIPEHWKISKQNTPLRYQMQPVIFADCGGGKLKKVLEGEKYKQFLVGVGGGLQFNLDSGLSLRVEWASPIGGDKPFSGQGASTFNLIFASEF